MTLLLFYVEVKLGLERTTILVKLKQEK